MVGISIQCRLGNQLFQYAFIKSLSIKLGCRFFISEKIEKFTLLEYFDLKDYHPALNTVYKTILKLQKGSLHNPLQNISIDKPDQAVPNEIYVGYFQSEDYFDRISNNISAHIKLKKKFQKKFEQEYKSLFKENKIIAIHIRRGDYLELDNWWKDNLASNNLSLPLSFYNRCLKEIENLNEYKILFVSDDINFTREHFSQVNNAIFKENDAIVDFQIIMNADICILSNSSFAWWAAYLNPKSEKLIFCPKYWLGFKIKKEYPENIIPQSWIQIKAD